MTKYLFLLLACASALAMYVVPVALVALVIVNAQSAHIGCITMTLIGAVCIYKLCKYMGRDFINEYYNNN